MRRWRGMIELGQHRGMREMWVRHCMRYVRVMVKTSTLSTRGPSLGEISIDCHANSTAASCSFPLSLIRWAWHNHNNKSCFWAFYLPTQLSSSHHSYEIQQSPWKLSDLRLYERARTWTKRCPWRWRMNWAVSTFFNDRCVLLIIWLNSNLLIIGNLSHTKS